MHKLFNGNRIHSSKGARRTANGARVRNIIPSFFGRHAGNPVVCVRPYTRLEKKARQGEALFYIYLVNLDIWATSEIDGSALGFCV